MDLQHPLLQRGGGLHGLDAIAGEVQQHLLDHGPVGQHRGWRLCDLHLDAGTALAGLQAHQGQHGFHQAIDRNGLAGLFAAPHEAVHALDDAARTLGLLGDARQGLLHQPLQLFGRQRRPVGCLVGHVGPRGVAAGAGLAGIASLGASAASAESASRFSEPVA